ncbi:FAD-dependent thymidylate synthase [Candidatus Chlamydia sanziniae]|uniref:Thymidylate synthase thyX n=1 Tax=Candidatus Chlamydia sanziniae TaxID=1806891 RepID=A0A1A9HU92_9CHLA|nr:FAD-dependent thymidylate synthase [Candidatus Chlamydia sanziniae]ANH78549.1 Thymidylate synthase thyX [Candidatus Chlamydia sanziniae]
MLGREEKFSSNEKRCLSRFVTNLESNVFGLKNLPEVVKGALFSKYSRSLLGLRSLLLKEFIEHEESSSCFNETTDCVLGVQKAADFYQRILDNFGDDSVGELGGAHLAMENVSILAAKVLEDARIGGSPLEKSTRYVYFDQKVRGEYLYYRDPILMTSAFKDVFLGTCNFLFETYSDLIPQVRTHFEKLYPRDSEISESAYAKSLRAKVLDCIRGILPAATLTNLGFFANGRFWQNLIHKLQAHNLSELRLLGEQSLTELMKIIPSFLSRAEPHHHHHQAMLQYRQTLQKQMKSVAKHFALEKETSQTCSSVRLIYGDPEGIYKIAAAFLFPYSQRSFSDLIITCKQMSQEDLFQVLDSSVAARENRRHKSPRGLECVEFGFDIMADFGIYRDLQRHRTLTQERQLLSVNHGYTLPEDLLDTPMEKPYRDAMARAYEAYNQIAQEFPEEAQYVVPMAYNIRWFFHINVRALQWLCELRSQPQGHPNYRAVAINMTQEIIKFDPLYQMFFKFVNYSDVGLGRLHQEIRKEIPS